MTAAAPQPPFDLRWDEPLDTVRREAPTRAAFGSARTSQLEFSSRGDRATARLVVPASDGPHPLVVLQHGLHGSAEADYLDIGARWVDAGAALLSVDLPLHGPRASAKMTTTLSKSVASALSHGALSATETALWTEFARQTVSDLGRALDACEALPDVDASRVAFAGLSLGAITGVAFCAVDPRPRAAVLAVAGGGFGPSEIDPCSWIARIAPRPVLVVGAKDDATIPASATEALFEAAAEPRRIEWFDGDHGTLPGVALKSMWQALREALEISD